MHSDPWTLEEIKQTGYRVVDLIAEHLTGLPDAPVFRPVPPELVDDFLTAPLPQQGSTPEQILSEFEQTVLPYPFGNGHPRFWGWVNSPPSVIGIFAEALAAAMNPSCAGGNHAAIYVERQVLDWFKQMLGFPSDSMGLLVSGGSMATLTALTVARNTKAGPEMRSSGLRGLDHEPVIYMGEEGHGCVRKATELLGIGSNNLRVIASDDRHTMSVSDLERAIIADIEAGHTPIAVVATAGTVNTGAIDPLKEIAEVCQEHNVWLHIDGAYGAPALLTDRYRSQLEHLALADSIAIDPHKWLYVPVEAGLVLIRHEQAMRDTFSLVPPYLRTDGSPTGVGGLPWFSEYGFQQTRGFRALKVWMTLKYYGVDGYRREIEADLALAEHLKKLASSHPDLDMVASGLSIVCFRYVPPGIEGGDQLDALNKALLEEIQLGGEAFLSSTIIDGRFVLRACIVNHRTTKQDIEFLVDLVRATGARLRTE